MSNEIVKYSNRLNTIPLGRLNANELNLFISLVQQSYQKGTRKLTFTFKQLQSLSKYDRSSANFVKDLMKTNSKLLSINAYTDDGDTITQFACWELFQIQKSKQLLTVQVNPHFQKLFNDLSHWTRFQLAQFNELHSAYAKNMFRLIKQYRTVGRLKLTKEELFKQLDLPKTYQKKTSNVQTRVLNPIKEELSPIIRGLAIKTLRGAGRGRPVVGYEFTWHPEAKNADDFEKGRYADQRRKLDNIDLNKELSPKEKARAYDRVLGYKLGTTNPNLWKQASGSGKSSDVENQLTEKDKFDQYRELLKTWVQYFNKLDMKTTGKLKALLDAYGLENVKAQIKRYASLTSLNVDIPTLLEMIENSLVQEREE
ncbi:replication initiation protein [Limosilactobacillus pontis]|uniref:Replication initiation protein n=1 Tax=Limosilactobacillus pontis TaxID=35787 RepID=A0ABT7V088_9LACO|nr:replication initiation protein [Limosilactobacillus pontis]MDM8267366.1 replication initiation protein [Limosilactobacillus pontis]